MFGFENLDRNQKAIIGYSTILSLYFLILLVLDILDGSFDEYYNIFYFVGFGGLTGFYLRATTYPESRINNFRPLLHVLFLVQSFGTVLAYILFNSGSLFRVQYHMGTPVLSLVLIIFLILDNRGSKKLSSEESASGSAGDPANNS